MQKVPLTCPKTCMLERAKKQPDRNIQLTISGLRTLLKNTDTILASPQHRKAFVLSKGAKFATVNFSI